MSHLFFLIELRSKEAGEFVGWHDGTWPVKEFHLAKLYRAVKNAERALAYHKHLAQRFDISIVPFEAKELLCQ